MVNEMFLTVVFHFLIGKASIKN